MTLDDFATAQSFYVPAIISETGIATDFKFGRYIHRVHPNKSPLKCLEKWERGRIQGLRKVFKYLLLSQERVKLRTSNLAGTFTGFTDLLWHKGALRSIAL